MPQPNQSTKQPRESGTSDLSIAHNTASEQLGNPNHALGQLSHQDQGSDANPYLDFVELDVEIQCRILNHLGLRPLQLLHDARFQSLTSSVDDLIQWYHRASQYLPEFQMSTPPGSTPVEPSAPAPVRFMEPTIRQTPYPPIAPLQWNTCLKMRDIPKCDYVFGGMGAIQFTAVDIIVYLSNWCQNAFIAQRFLNNNITYAVHEAILKAHRYHEESIHPGYSAAMLRTRYIAAMRGHDCSTKPEPNAWTREAHKTPEDWQMLDISVNDFVPDIKLGSWLSAPVPFLLLTRGVRQAPRGRDAGDLTRMMEYAQKHQFLDDAGNACEYLFPDHIQVILDEIGRLKTTHEHSDPAVFRRYEKAAQSNAKSKRLYRNHAATQPE